MAQDIEKIWPGWRAAKLLGTGSVGTVYQAVRTDGAPGQAAVKVISIPQSGQELEALLAGGMDREAARAALHRTVEALVQVLEAAKSLQGVRNILRVEEYAVAEHTEGIGWDVYIRTELLTPFDAWYTAHELTEQNVLQLGVDLCAALEACAEKGIVHQDVKPENIFVDEEGFFKLGDIGVVRVLEAAQGGPGGRRNFSFLSPEVAAGQDYDARADIYSLGVILYSLLNGGRLPFLDSDEQLMDPAACQDALERRLRGEPLPPPQYASRAVAGLLLCACAPSPDRRFKNAGVMKRALESLCGDPDAARYCAPAELALPPVDPDAETLPLTFPAEEAAALPPSAPQEDEATLPLTFPGGDDAETLPLGYAPAEGGLYSGLAADSGAAAYDPAAGIEVHDIPAEDDPWAAADAQEKKGKKGRRVVLLLVLLAVLAALGALGFFGWKFYQESKNAVIDGVSYVPDETTALEMVSPTEQDWAEFAKLTALEELSVSGSGEGDLLRQADLEQIAALEALTSVKFDNVRFESGLAALAGAERLEELALTNCALTSEQCAALPELAGLKTLCLAGNQIGDLSFLSRYTALEELDLSGNRITDYMALAPLSKLTSLSVDHTQAPALESLTLLDKLVVGGEDVGSVDGYILEQASTARRYERAIESITQKDTDAIRTLIEEYGENPDDDSSVTEYANGYMLGTDSSWDLIRASLPGEQNILKLDTSGVYYGQMANGQRAGEGVQYFAGNMSFYTGEWQNDLPNGSGSYCKTTAEGVLWFDGEYLNGYENGTMTFSMGEMQLTYTAENGTRETIKKISSSQYAFAQAEDGTYWCDSSPSGHGVCVGDIPYQEETRVKITPKAQKKTTTSGSTSTPAPAAPSTPTLQPDFTVDDTIDFLWDMYQRLH